jgi:hypothetical protein
MPEQNDLSDNQVGIVREQTKLIQKTISGSLSF